MVLDSCGGVRVLQNCGVACSIYKSIDITTMGVDLYSPSDLFGKSVAWEVIRII